MCDVAEDPHPNMFDASSMVVRNPVNGVLEWTLFSLRLCAVPETNVSTLMWWGPVGGGHRILGWDLQEPRSDVFNHMGVNLIRDALGDIMLMLMFVHQPFYRVDNWPKTT